MGARGQESFSNDNTLDDYEQIQSILPSSLPGVDMRYQNSELVGNNTYTHRSYSVTINKYYGPYGS